MRIRHARPDERAALGVAPFFAGDKRRHPPQRAICAWCRGPMPDGLRSHARYCRAVCRVLASRANREAVKAAQSVNAATL